MLSPAAAGSNIFVLRGLEHFVVRLILGLAPQALCFRPLRGCRKEAATLY
jgi:hypothetical protein